MLALPPRPVDAMLAPPTNYLAHQALQLAAPPIPGSSACSPIFPSSSISSALSFYESVPRAISPAPSTRPRSSNAFRRFTSSKPRSGHRTIDSDGLDSITNGDCPTLSPVETRRAPSPFPHASHRGSFPFQSRQTTPSPASCFPTSSCAGTAVENGDLAVTESNYDRASTSPPPSSTPPFLCRSITPRIDADAPSVLESQAAPRRARRPESAAYAIPDLSRVLLSDPEPVSTPTKDDPESEFERRFVPLAPNRAKVTRLRGPHARSVADVQRFLPPFGCVSFISSIGLEIDGRAAPACALCLLVLRMSTYFACADTIPPSRACPLVGPHVVKTQSARTPSARRARTCGAAVTFCARSSSSATRTATSGTCTLPSSAGSTQRTAGNSRPSRRRSSSGVSSPSRPGRAHPARAHGPARGYEAVYAWEAALLWGLTYAASGSTYVARGEAQAQVRTQFSTADNWDRGGIRFKEQACDAVSTRELVERGTWRIGSDRNAPHHGSKRNTGSADLRTCGLSCGRRKKGRSTPTPRAGVCDRHCNDSNGYRTALYFRPVSDPGLARMFCEYSSRT